MINIKIENNDFDNFEKYIEENKINIEEIEKIELINCKKIRNLPKINNLKELIINECDNLELPIECINLEKLTIYEKDFMKDFNNVDINMNSKKIKLQIERPIISVIPDIFTNLKELILYNSSIELSNKLINLEKIVLNNSYIDVIYLSQLQNLKYLEINSNIDNLILDSRINVLKYLKLTVLYELSNANKCYTTDKEIINLMSLFNHQKLLKLSNNDNVTLCIEH